VNAKTKLLSTAYRPIDNVMTSCWRRQCAEHCNVRPTGNDVRIRLCRERRINTTNESSICTTRLGSVSMRRTDAACALARWQYCSVWNDVLKRLRLRHFRRSRPRRKRKSGKH